MKYNKLDHKINETAADLFSGKAFSLKGDVQTPVTLRLPENQALAADIAKLKSQPDNIDNPAIFNERIFDIQVRHYDRCQTRKEQVEAELAKLKRRYESENKEDPAAVLLRLERYKAECEVAKDVDLQLLLEGAVKADSIEKKTSYDPDKLRAAAAVMQRRGKTYEAGLLSMALDQVNAGQPWVNTPEGENLSQLKNLYDVEFGMIRVHPDVSGITQDYEISEVIGE